MPREARIMATSGGYPPWARLFTGSLSGRATFQIPYFKAIHIQYIIFFLLYQKNRKCTIAIWYFQEDGMQNYDSALYVLRRMAVAAVRGASSIPSTPHSRNPRYRANRVTSGSMPMCLPMSRGSSTDRVVRAAA